MRQRIVALFAVLAVATAAHAQDDLPAAGQPPTEPVQTPRWTSPEPEPPDLDELGPQRAGFTLMLAIGVGYQTNNPDETANEINQIGLGGINLGIGGFLTPDLALLFRTSNTTVFLDEGAFEQETAWSGVAGLGVQYWPLDSMRVEVGVGLGYQNYQFRNDNVTIRREEAGLGLLFAIGAAFWQNARHSLQLGIDYAPAFVEDGPAHNLSFTFGWQLL